MVNIATLSLLLAGTISSVMSQRWVQTWSDEFDGTTIDMNKWKYDTGNNGWGNNELEFYTDRPENSGVWGGMLFITARREDYGGSQYTSARMNTAGHFST